MEIGTKHKKTCPVLTGFIRTCAGCGVVPSQGRTVSAGSRDVQRSSYHPVTSQHLICYQLERKALNFTAAWLFSVPVSVPAAFLINGKRRAVLQRDLSHVMLTWIRTKLLPRLPEPQFSFSLCSQQLGEDGEQEPQATG